MADSRFLKWQDKNGDNLIDICEIELPRKEKVCLDCIPNPNAIVQRWKKRNLKKPFLNEKLCKYQITNVTAYTNTGASQTATPSEAKEILNGRYEEHARETVEALLTYYNKDDSAESIDKILSVLEYTDYDLDARALSHLKLLYSVPFSDLNDLDDAIDDPEEEEELGPTVTTYIPSILIPNLIRVRKGLNLYASNLKVYRALDGKNLVFEGGNVFNLDLYGDFVLWGSSVTEKIMPSLTDFLLRSDLILDRPSIFFPRYEGVSKFECTFSAEFKLTKMKVWTESCGDKPRRIYNKKKLEPLNNTPAFKDSTAMAYFAKVDDMERDLTARNPKPWAEFVKEYTYPKVVEVTRSAPGKADPNLASLGCVGEALNNEFKQLGQDILDDVFSIGDAIAAQFHKSLCEKDYEKFLEQEFKFGKVEDPSIDPNLPIEERQKNIWAFAQEQAFGELEERDQIFVGLCARMFSSFGGGGQATLDKLWQGSLDPIRLCGLFDMMLDAIQCLFKGLTFEEVMAAMIKSALQAMSIEHFGDLFLGLSPDKQAKLDALVKRKLESGDISGPGRNMDNLSTGIESGVGPNNVPFYGEIDWVKPWDNPEIIERQKRDLMVEGPYEGMSPTGYPTEGEPDSELGKATAIAQMENAGEGLSPNVIMEAYVLALIEEYSDDLLSLMHELDRFPGARVVAFIIATLDCPRPPLFDPSLVDFLKDIELPFCRNTQHIGLPRLENPFGWLPKLWDILRILYRIFLQMLQELVIKIIIKLIVFICELLGDAICKALEVAGQMAASLPAVLGGRTTFAEVIKESICGPDADQEQIENTMQEMFNNLGEGGAALADKDMVMNFAEDLSSTTTRSELINAINGNPSQSFLDIIDSLVEFEYPEFASTFSNSDKTGKFFANTGNLMSAEARAALNDLAGMLAEDDMMPANPSLCATPADIEQFCEARAALLEGRASPDQIAAMCEAGRDTLKNDLEDIGDILQKGIPAYFEQNMPAVMSSDPTCDDGLLPFEPKEVAAANTAALNNTLDLIKVAYSQDMLGNGPLQSNWGFMNMILSDTQGRAYTHHRREVASDASAWFPAGNVDFNVDGGSDDLFGDYNYVKTKKQKGALPLYVADYLFSDGSTEVGEMERAIVASSFDSNNEEKDDKEFDRTFEELNFTKLFDDVDLLTLPDYGYNTKVSVQWPADDEGFGNGKVNFTRKARKATPDIKLTFRDNSRGEKKDDDGFAYGFNVKLYVSDIIKKDGAYRNREDDNARILIEKVINNAVDTPGSGEYEAEASDEESEKTENSITTFRAYEFLAVDDGLDNEEFEEGDYIQFRSALATPITSIIPQVILLREMIEKQNIGIPPVLTDLKNLHDQAMNAIFSKFAEDIYTNKAAFEYGAQLDDLAATQIEYGMKHNNTFLLFKDYLDATETDPADAPLGISRMQYNEENNDGPPNRVFYLDPLTYGGSYLNPPVHIKPVKKTGWLGMVDAMFPELSPCKPQRTDLVDFGSIQNIIDESYAKIPEDQRLKSDPDCITEKPYNRILERSSKAGIEGLIHAMCRIFVSINFLKSLATFTKFYPDFKNNFSTLYAAYIVELMEEELKDAQSNAFLEFWSPFKDDEFWYAFLEQAVQTYARKVASQDIEDVPSAVQAAMERLREKEKRYRYPDDDRLELAKAQNDAWLLQTLKNYRYEKNLEAIKETDEDAKTVLREFVIQEMEFMAEIFMKNLQEVGIFDKDTIVENLGYYILENLTKNTSLTLNKELTEEVVGLPTSGSGLYTNGDALALSDGEPYTGYYHVDHDEDGSPIYTTGEEHSSESHETLRPFANKVIVPIGSIGGLASSAAGTSQQPFIAEVYVKINGEYVSPSTAIVTMAASPDPALNISDVYPGTMKVIRAPSGQVVGLSGELGVRYGLRFSIGTSSSKYTITEVEIDALDLPVGKFQPLEADSKLLLCLINNLMDDNKFKMLTRYVFPLNKILSTLAIYNDMAFLPSIGELTTTNNEGNAEKKPGKYVVVDTEDGVSVAKLENGARGWATANERWPGSLSGGGFWTLHFDKWNRSFVTKSKARVKKLFKYYYHSREWGPEERTTAADSGIAALRAAFSFSPGERYFPWFKKGLLRGNPFNANDELCTKSD